MANTNGRARARTAKASGNGNRRWTKEHLDYVAEMDRPALVELAAEYGIQPGRGITNSVMVRRILEATGAQPVINTKAPTGKRAASGKEAPVKKKAVRATRKAGSTPRRLSVVAQRSDGASHSVQGHQVPKEAVRDFIDAAIAALEVAKALL